MRSSVLIIVATLLGVLPLPAAAQIRLDMEPSHLPELYRVQFRESEFHTLLDERLLQRSCEQFRSELRPPAKQFGEGYDLLQNAQIRYAANGNPESRSVTSDGRWPVR